MKMQRTTTLFALTIALGLLITACSRLEPEEPTRGSEPLPANEADDAEIATTQPDEDSRSGTMVLAEGHLVAARPMLPLSFTVGGRLTDIQVQPGDVVHEGDILATLDDSTLAEAVTSAELQVRQAENALAQAQLALDNLLNWEADEMAVAVAEANLVVAETNYENALEQDSASGDSLTSARVTVDQATRALSDAQEAYDKAWEPARDWELNDPWRKQALEFERDATTRGLQNAQEGLQVARANYNLALAGLNDESALTAEANVVSASQALDQVQTGPEESEVAAARLQVEQAKLSVEQAKFNLEQTERALDDAVLLAPWNGTIFSVDTTKGALVGGGTPIVTLQDPENLQFHTTNLSERDLVDIQSGQNVRITLKTYPGREINGTVVRILPQASGAIGDAATFVVIVELEPSGELLLPGMTGRAEILRE